MRILIIEDETRLAEALVHILNKNRYSAEAKHDGESGYDEALTGSYDAIILDIMLPKMNGFDVLRGLRREKISTPIILLTAKDEIKDKVSGLDLGADDYLTKPFSTDELLARLRAVIRRKNEAVCDDLLSFSDLGLNLSTYELSCGDKAVKLGLKEFDTMKLLMNYGIRVLSKEILIEKVWGYDSEADHNNVEVYISFLRKKLLHLKSSVSIKTIRGAGYSLDASRGNGA